MAPRRKAPDIEITDLVAGYPGRIILNGVNVSLPGGRVSVILGGSGCGKSTLLRHILGLSRPFGGTIQLGEKNLSSMDDTELHHLRSEMGVLFQDGALLGSLTLGENVAMPLREHTNLDETTIETMVRLKLNLLGLEPFADYLPNQLSGGMRKRAGLARALVLDPHVLLCDEPSAGLDPITAAELDQLIQDLNQTFGMTIVVVTHDLDSLFTIAEYVVVLHEGKVLYQGEAAGLKCSEDPYIQQFLNRIPNERGTGKLLEF